jgi:hypothetical protein
MPEQSQQCSSRSVIGDNSEIDKQRAASLHHAMHLGSNATYRYGYKDSHFCP